MPNILKANLPTNQTPMADTFMSSLSSWATERSHDAGFLNGDIIHGMNYSIGGHYHSFHYPIISAEQKEFFAHICRPILDSGIKETGNHW